MKVHPKAPPEFREMTRWSQWDIVDADEIKRRADLRRKYRRWREAYANQCHHSS